MKVMWHSVPGNFGTGYGTQTRIFVRELKRLGLDMVISSIVPPMPTYRGDDGVKVLSAGQALNAIGNHFVMSHFERERPDVVVSLMDTFVMDKSKFSRLPWVAWQVVDSAPLMEELKPQASVARKRLAMSRFGQRVLADAGFDSEYVPLAYDENQFFPEDHWATRDTLSKTWNTDLSGRFLLVMNMANMSRPSRKNFAAGIRAVMDLKRLRPGCRPVLYIHSEVTGAVSGGENIIRIAKSFGAKQEDVIMPPQYEYCTGFFDHTYLRTVYSAADVLLHPARGEGFGLPIVEAQACGCSVVATDCSAIRELVCTESDAGILVRGVEFMHIPGSNWVEVDRNGLHSALHAYASCHAYRPRTREKVRDYVAQYEIKKVAATLVKVLQNAVNGWAGTQFPTPEDKNDASNM